jgi:hypothetical protein
MVAAWRELSYCGQGCFAHRIEKVTHVYFDCPDHKPAMVKARKLAGFYHHSTQAMAQLKTFGALILAPDHPQGLAPVQDVVTRWWSTFSLCDRLNTLRPVFEALRNVEHGIFYPADCQLTNTEWDVIAMGQVVLRPFMFAQRNLEGELYVTNSLVVGMIYQLRENLHEELLKQESDANAERTSSQTNIVSCLRKMVLEFSVRFGDGTNVVPFNTPFWRAEEGVARQPRGITLWQALASCLDIRTKDLFGIPEEEHANLWERVSALAVDIGLRSPAAGAAGESASTVDDTPAKAAPPEVFTPVADGASRQVGSSTPQALRNEDASGGHHLNFNRRKRVAVAINRPLDVVIDMRQHITNAVRIELINFAAVPIAANLSFNTLNWWKINQHLFPYLAALARLVLAVPATSAPSERMWSEAGLVVSKLRTALREESVAMLVFLRAIDHFEKRHGIEL